MTKRKEGTAARRYCRMHAVCLMALMLGVFGCAQPAQQNETRTVVSFSNATKGPVDVYQVDADGVEQFKKTIAEGQGDDFESVAAHIWHFKQDDQLIDSYEVGTDPRQFHIITLAEQGGEGRGIETVNEDAGTDEEPAGPPEKSLRAVDFAPDHPNPNIRYLPDGFVLPNIPVSMWSKAALFDLDKNESFTLAFDALLTDERQEIIVAFSNNKIPWGQEGADALTVRLSPQDQDVWFRTGFYENWLDPQLYYNSSEKPIQLNRSQRYTIRLTSSDLSVSIDGRPVAAAQLDNAAFPRSGAVGFVVFSNPDFGNLTVSYQNITVRDVPRPRDEPIAQNGSGNRDFSVVEPTDPGTVNLASAGRYHALIIGVQDYIDTTINDLDFPVRDAENFTNILLGNYTFAPEDVTLLRNPTKARITNALDSLVTNVKPEDNLLIFYAGHGYWDERMKQGFWLPADAEKGFRANWLSNGTIRDYINGIQAHHTLLISDACFSGGIFKTRAAFSGADRATEELFKLPSRKAMTSGTLKEVPDKSVFVEYLIKKLQENDKPFLTTDALFNALREPVINNSPLDQVPQFGVIQSTGDEGGEFVFRRAAR